MSLSLLHHLSLQSQAQRELAVQESWKYLFDVPGWEEWMGSPCRSYANKWAPVGVCLRWLEHSHQQPPDRKRKWFLKKNWWILGLNIQPRRKTVIYKGYKLTERSKNFSPPPHSPHSLCSPPCPPPTVITSPPTKVSACCFRSYHAPSEGSSLTFDVAQNWISSLIFWPSPSPRLIHAVTNWVACQRPGV